MYKIQTLLLRVLFTLPNDELSNYNNIFNVPINLIIKPFNLT